MKEHVHQMKSLGELLDDLGDAVGEIGREIAKRWREAMGQEPEPEAIPIPVEREPRRPMRDEFTSLNFEFPRE